MEEEEEVGAFLFWNITHLHFSPSSEIRIMG
jgi:hypothetical protein